MKNLTFGLSVAAVLLSIAAFVHVAAPARPSVAVGGTTNFNTVDADTAFSIGGTTVVDSSRAITASAITSSATTTLNGTSLLKCGTTYNGATTTTTYYFYASGTSVVATTTKPALCP